MSSKFKIINFKIDIHSTKFKASILTLMSVIFCIVFFIAFTKFNTTDTVPELIPINTKAIKELGPFAANVKTGLFIKNFPVFDVIKNNFTIDAVVWFEFNSDEIPLSTIEKFSFNQDAILSKTPPDIRVFGNKVFVKFNVTVNLKIPLNFHKFPFEDHIISIMLSNDFVTPNEMYFTTDSNSFQVAPDIFPTSWKLKDLSVNSGFLHLDLDKQDKTKKVAVPKALFVIDVSKNGIRKALIIFIPLITAVFLGLFSFVMNISNIVGKFSITVSALTALLGYRFVIEQMIPQVGYLTATDTIYLLFLLITLACFISQLFIIRRYLLYVEEAKASKHEEHKIAIYKEIANLEKINSYIFIALSIILTVLISIIILK